MVDIYVYGDIGESFWGDDTSVSASDFSRQLRDADGDDVTIHVNSVGGNVFDANTMSELVRSYKGRTTTSIEGVAASAASFFALTADSVVMNPSALIMIHNPYTSCYGNADEMRKTADMLDKVRSTITGQYVRKTGMDESEVEEMMDAETWLEASEALDLGFVDSISDAAPIAARLTKEALDRFKSAPKSLMAQLAAAGDTGASIDPSESKAKAQGTEAGAEAAPRVVCINGMFLKL
jgi:ATP-dependent protease ClpP protease subunit